MMVLVVVYQSPLMYSRSAVAYSFIVGLHEPSIYVIILNVFRERYAEHGCITLDRTFYGRPRCIDAIRLNAALGRPVEGRLLHRRLCREVAMVEYVGMSTFTWSTSNTLDLMLNPNHDGKVKVVEVNLPEPSTF